MVSSICTSVATGESFIEILRQRIFCSRRILSHRFLLNFIRVNDKITYLQYYFDTWNLGSMDIFWIFVAVCRNINLLVSGVTILAYYTVINLPCFPIFWAKLNLSSIAVTSSSCIYSIYIYIYIYMLYHH